MIARNFGKLFTTFFIDIGLGALFHHWSMKMCTKIFFPTPTPMQTQSNCHKCIYYHWSMLHDNRKRQNRSLKGFVRAHMEKTWINPTRVIYYCRLWFSLWDRYRQTLSAPIKIFQPIVLVTNVWTLSPWRYYVIYNTPSENRAWDNYLCI